jgi:lysophospholipase L1-like esterase
MAVFQELADRWGIPSIDLAPTYLEQADPSQLYRENDNIHINAAGQEVLAPGLSRCHALSQVPTVPEER